MLHPELSNRLNDLHRQELLRQAQQEQLALSVGVDEDTVSERLLHWIGGELAIVARLLEAYHRPQPACVDCD